MRFWAMRFIDYWLGRPLCLLLTLWRRLMDPILPADAANAPRRMLFIKLEEQGALVLAAGAVKRAEMRYGRENIYFCAFAESRPILDAMELLPPENIFTIRTDNVFVIFYDTLRVIAKARRIGMDAIIDLEFFARGSAILAYLCGGKRRVGLHRFGSETPYRGDLMTHRVAYNPYLHTAHAYDALVRALDADPRDLPLLKARTPEEPLPLPAFAADPATRDALRRKLDKAFGDAPPGPIIVLHPNCTDVLRVRKWPEDRYAALARGLLESHPAAAVVFTGLAQEQLPIAALCAAIASPRAVSLAGAISLRELLALFCIADVLVTNDSGPAHFAALTPIHAVALFGPETPLLFAPLGGRTRVLYAPLACSPCLTPFNYRHSPCRNNVCVQEIRVEQVLDAVNAALAERQRERATPCG